MSFGPRSCSWPPTASTTTRSPPGSTRAGGRVEVAQALLRARPARARGAPARRSTPGPSPLRSSSPSRRWPASCRLDWACPLSRFHVPDLAAEAVSRGIVADICGTTIWRWLSEDAIRPWAQRSLDLPSRPRLRAQGQPGARPLRPHLERQTVGETGLRHQLRREDLHPGPHPQSIPPCRPQPAGRCASSTSTTAAAPSPTSPPGTSIAPRSSAAANRPPASNHSAASSPR